MYRSSPQYPLDLTFKVVALAPQLSLTDSAGNLLFYVRQKLFKLKEAVTVYADTAQTQPLYTMNADRILDISAQYRINDINGMELGALKRHGMSSLWKAHYSIIKDGQELFTIREENGWIKVLDALVGEIPIINFFTGYIFHPAYLLTRTDGTVIARMVKKAAFFESKFSVESRLPLPDDEERLVQLALVMMVLLERSRG